MNIRKWVILLAVISALISLNSCGSGNAATTETSEAPQSNSLSVFDWAGYELPEFWTQFAEQHPDIKIDYSFFGEDAEAFAKIQTGFQTDIIHPCGSWWKLYIDNGLVQPLDVSRLENFKDIPESLIQYGNFDGKQYFVPWDWGYESILVRTDKVSEIPDSWEDLWNPEYAGHVTVYDSGETQHMVGATVLGFDPFNTTPEQDEAITQKLIELKPNLLTYWTDYTEIVQLMSSGDVWIAANAWPDSFLVLREQGIPVEYLTPVEGRMGYICGYGISAKAQNLDLAYDYLNALTNVEAMAFLVDYYGYGPANAAALAQADPETVNLLQLNDPAILEKTVFYESLTAEQRETVVTNWDRVKAAP